MSERLDERLRRAAQTCRELGKHTTENVFLEASDTICKLRGENARLRELVRKYGEYTDQDRCEGCVCKSRCNDGDVDECWQLTEIRGLARELGVATL